MHAVRWLSLAALTACGGSLPLAGSDAAPDVEALDSAPPPVDGGPDATVDAPPDVVDATVNDVASWDGASDAPQETSPPPLWWEQTLGGYTYFLAVDGSKNVLVGGNASGAYYGTILLEEYDALGSPIWKKAIVATTVNVELSLASVAFDPSGDMLMAGYTQGDIDFGGGTMHGPGAFIVEYDPSGTFLRQVGPFPNTTFRKVVADSKGAIIGCGTIIGTCDYGGGSISTTGQEDPVVAKFDATGAYVYAKHWGDSARQMLDSCVADSSDAVLLTGMFEAQLDFGGGALQGAPVGEISNTSAGDIYVAKIDAAGAYVAAVELKTIETNVGSIAVDSSGNAFVTGVTQTSMDFGGGTLTVTPPNSALFVGKLTSSLGYQWAKVFDTNSGGRGVATDPSGDVALVGAFTTSIDFGCGKLTGTTNNSNGFVTKLDPAGNCLTSRLANGNVWPEDIAFMSQSDWAITGTFGGATSGFPGLPYLYPVPNSSADTFVVRWAP